MRRFIVALVLTVAFGAGVLAGLSNNEAKAATKCWTTECQNGESLYCCRTNGKVLCKVQLCN